MELNEYLDTCKEIENLIKKRERYRNELKDWTIHQFEKLYRSIGNLSKEYFERSLSVGFVWCEPDVHAFSKLEKGAKHLHLIIRYGDIYDSVAIPRDKPLSELSLDEMKLYSKWYKLNCEDATKDCTKKMKANQKTV